MIIPTGNNFGCSAIEIKDYQSEKVVVLNSKFTIDPKNEAYKNASVLEIYVPDLSLDKSSDSSCFMRSAQLMWPDQSYRKTYGVGTVLRTWIKDKNTICIEKLPIYDEQDQVDIVLATLYVQKGKRTTIEKSPTTKVTFSYPNVDMYEDNVICVVEVTKLLDVQPADALNGTTVLNTIALMKGAHILRVHDVAAAVEVVKLCNECKKV